ncbi:AidA/PixA family protein [Paraburkholderia terricola]|uniref:Inclusion body protein n=1 Tax=Paraburkholderia terricola TaxID=169427 RepID=A0A1M6UIS9_9BURK|nr:MULTISPECIES: AidA/PixA family protein [Paraburkholderia]SDO95137.1 Inclusion body protein [Paraburkholderia sediminicola]SHK69053.1 Inclusion body protein [Paraburkholderia terricola]
MTSDVTLLATTQQVNILVVIDTEYVKAITKNPSKDWKTPTGITHTGQFMLCTGSRGPVKGQGTGDLEFMA